MNDIDETGEERMEKSLAGCLGFVLISLIIGGSIISVLVRLL